MIRRLMFALGTIVIFIAIVGTVAFIARDLVVITRDFSAGRLIHHPIEGWMTFEYLNRVYRLDPQRLELELNITDRRYPRLTIRRYASERGINTGTAIQRVQTAIDALTASSTR